MAVGAVIFDMDGTLVDTNAVHVEAWRRAFRGYGYEVEEDRIMEQIGKGGDMLVPSILDEKIETEIGEQLRDTYGKEFIAIASSQRFELFPKAAELLQTLRERGIKTSIATSSTTEYLDATQKSANCDLGAMVDAMVTSSDAKKSKPEPDIVLAAVEKLGVSIEECVMVGDTPHDAEACRRANVAFVGLTSGGHSELTLRAAGAVAVWDDAAAMLKEIDQLLQLELLPAAQR